MITFSFFPFSQKRERESERARERESGGGENVCRLVPRRGVGFWEKVLGGRFALGRGFCAEVGPEW